MKNLDKYLTLLDGDVDGLLLTSRYSRHYGAEFDIAEGVAIVTKKGCRYFTDSRYIESAEKNLKGFEVLDVNREVGYIQRLNTAIADFGVTTLGYEEHYLTAEEYFHYDEKLNAKLVPFHKPIYAFRGYQGGLGAGADAQGAGHHRQSLCRGHHPHQARHDRAGASGGADLLHVQERRHRSGL